MAPMKKYPLTKGGQGRTHRHLEDAALVFLICIILAIVTIVLAVTLQGGTNGPA